MAVVDRADPARHVGEARRIRLVRAPLIRLPVHEVLDDHVERDPTAPELVHGVQALLRRGVAVAALPVAERVARRHRRPARDEAVARDHAVELGAVEEVVVHPVADLRPERRVLGRRRRLPPELHRLPFALDVRVLEAHAVAPPRFQPHPGDAAPRQPPGTPVVDDELAAHPELHDLVREQLDLVGPGGVAARGTPPSARSRGRARAARDGAERPDRSCRSAWRRGSRNPRACRPRCSKAAPA